jgi:hypothetical protein
VGTKVRSVVAGGSTLATIRPRTQATRACEQRAVAHAALVETPSNGGAAPNLMRWSGRGAHGAPASPGPELRPAPRHAPAAHPPAPFCAALPSGAGAPYVPRRPEHSPLYRVRADHFEALERVHEERFARLEHGFARVQGRTCRAEFLVAFRCHGRSFCPSCHARRLAEWSLWLDEQLLAQVPYRQVVLALPKRLRPYFLPDRRRLGGLSRVAYRTLRAYLRAALGERDLAPGAIVCVQTFGSLAHAHPHLPDGTFVPAPAHEPAVLEEAWRSAVLRWFVAEEWLEEEAAQAMLAWPHAGFGAHLGPRIAAEDREGLLRVARYAARAPWPTRSCVTTPSGPRSSGCPTRATVPEPQVARRILAHLERRGIEARAGPWAGAAAAPG